MKKVTVLWEDQLDKGAKSFGPHELLLSALVDALEDLPDKWHSRRHRIQREVQGIPKKGNGNVLATLQENIDVYRGEVVAVIDRDKAHRLWKDTKPSPPNCMQGISRQFHKSAPGTYELIFLINHTEDLLDAVLGAMQEPALKDKPTPNERDRIFNRAAWDKSRDVRAEVGRRCPSFQRIVEKILRHFPRR